jgi:hypothetical protein
LVASNSFASKTKLPHTLQKLYIDSYKEFLAQESFEQPLGSRKGAEDILRASETMVKGARFEFTFSGEHKFDACKCK